MARTVKRHQARATCHFHIEKIISDSIDNGSPWNKTQTTPNDISYKNPSTSDHQIGLSVCHLDSRDTDAQLHPMLSPPRSAQLYTCQAGVVGRGPFSRTMSPQFEPRPWNGFFCIQKWTRNVRIWSEMTRSFHLIHQPAKQVKRRKKTLFCRRPPPQHKSTAKEHSRACPFVIHDPIRNVNNCGVLTRFTKSIGSC